ncbi:MAG: GNAT family N-acetyltransferase [Hyphomonadaceae bacterium]|nr:GNAT family N-acetyltransferase [Hyphomonadaceae bacterium]
MPPPTAPDTRFQLRRSDLTEPEVIALLEYHVADMLAVSPPGTSFALDLEALAAPGMSVWALWAGDRVAGCGAMKQHDATMVELKSMRAHPGFLRQGVGRRLLEHLIAEARTMGCREIKLETGTSQDFAAAIALYRRYGFVSCPAFADYYLTEHNQYFELQL